MPKILSRELFGVEINTSENEANYDKMSLHCDTF